MPDHRNWPILDGIAHHLYFMHEICKPTLVRLSRGLGMRFRLEITPEELALGS